VTFLFKSLITILPKADVVRLVKLSLMLVIIAFMEVFGLALISFLLVNLDNLTEAIQQLPYIDSFITFFQIPEASIINIFCICLGLYSIATLCLSIIIIRSVNFSGQLIGSRLRLNIIEYYLNSSWVDFYNSHASELTAKILNDGRQIGFLISFCLHLFSRFFLTFLIIAFLFVYNPILTMVLVMVLSSVYLLIIVGLQPAIKKHGVNTAKMMDGSLKILSNTFNSIKEIIFYDAQEKFISDYRKTDGSLVYSEASNQSLSQIPRFIIDAFILIALVISIYFFSRTSFDNQTFFAAISVYGVASLKLLPSFQNMYYFYHEILARQFQLKNITSIFKKIKNQSDLKDSNNLIIKESITLQDVSFSFHDKKNILEKINLKLHFGQNIAIVGPSGSGKSTLLDIILGFLTPEKGKIFIDEVELSDFNISNIKQNFSYIPQKVKLIEGTLRENILFGALHNDSSANEKRLQEVINLSCLNEVINQLPSGLDTVISDSNQFVSGGQKQCIGFARAFFKGGNILILDESTNAMDLSLEEEIFKNIPLAGFKMIIGITHKAGILNYFDEVCILNDGNVEALGPFSELSRENRYLLEMVHQDIN